NKFRNLYIQYMKEEVLKKFADKVRELRIKKNLSQEKLGELSNLHRTYIGMVERAEKNISLKNIQKIAKALNVRLENLFEGL
ncbi:MAG: helix-turn-helix transcriptional regulator, partial [Bacteroidota bacterium]